MAATKGWEVSDDRLLAFVIAFVVVLIFGWVFGGGLRPDDGSSKTFFGRLICGADGRPSTSKFQAVVWTAIALFGFVELVVERFLVLNTTSGDLSIPSNMLIAMGFSVTTMAAAKGITVSYAGRNLVDKSATKGRLLGGLTTDDDGAPDLSKTQMVAFTIIGVAVYLARMVWPDDGPPEFKDIEPTLMVLMGLSQGAYIGKKLTTIETPRVVGMTPAVGKAKAAVTLTGANFGDQQDGSNVLLDNAAIPKTNITKWEPSKIEFTMTDERRPGVPWKPGESVTVTVIANGCQANALAPFVFEA